MSSTITSNRSPPSSSNQQPQPAQQPQSPQQPQSSQQPQNLHVAVNAEGRVNYAQAGTSSTFETGSSSQTSTTGNAGGAETGTHTSVGPSLKIEGSAEGSIGPSGIDLNVSVEVTATLAEAGASATQTFTVEVGGEQLDVTVDLRAEGVIGANGKLNLAIHIGTDGQVSINAGAEGFAGARGALTGGITVSHEGRNLAEGSVELSATLGLSGNAHANVELTAEGISFDVGAEASVGGGFGVDIQGTINAGNTAIFAGEAAAGLAAEGSAWAAGQIEDAGEFISGIIPDIHIDLIPDNVPFIGGL